MFLPIAHPTFTTAQPYGAAQSFIETLDWEASWACEQPRKEKRISSNNTKKGWFSRSRIHNFTSYNASSKGTDYMADIMDSRYIFHFTSSWSHPLKNLLYKTMCLLPRCTEIYMTKMSYETLHVIKIPKAMKLLLPLPLITGLILNQCITISLFTLMLYSRPWAGNCASQWDLFSELWSTVKCQVHVV